MDGGGRNGTAPGMDSGGAAGLAPRLPPLPLLPPNSAMQQMPPGMLPSPGMLPPWGTWSAPWSHPQAAFMFPMQLPVGIAAPVAPTAHATVLLPTLLRSSSPASSDEWPAAGQPPPGPSDWLSGAATQLAARLRAEGVRLPAGHGLAVAALEALTLSAIGMRAPAKRVGDRWRGPAEGRRTITPCMRRAAAVRHASAAW